MRTSNIERRRRQKGDYMVLRTRSREHGDAVLPLGYLSEDAAQRAKEAMNEEEAAGTVARILKFAEDEPEDAVAFLTGDAGGVRARPRARGPRVAAGVRALAPDPLRARGGPREGRR